MPKFKTDVERMKHKQAKLIPSSMWYDNQLFYESLNDTVLSLMKAKPTNLMSDLNKSLPKLNNQWLKKQAWLGIALTQPIKLSMLQEVATTLKLNNNTLFSLLAILGNVAYLNEFKTQYNSEAILEMIADNEFYAYIKAAENGHSDVLKYFEREAPNLALKMLMSGNFSPYKNAARNNHIEVLEHFETKAPHLVSEMIRAQDFYACRIAGSKGNLEVLKHLEAILPELVKDMVGADNFYAFRKSVENNHLETSQWLLSKSSACFAYAEMHIREYGEPVIKSFIDQQLATFHRDALNVPVHGVFDIKDPEQAKICFYIIRNLIRRNQPTLQDEIRFLLNIPSVKALVHQEVTVGQANELIRLALTTGNQEAASILLNIPEVRTLTEQNDFYRAEISGQLNLAQLSNDHESAMTALTKGEQKRLNDAIQRYRPTLQSKGVGNLMNELRSQLRLRYEKNPASITSDTGVKIKLPMDFAELQKLKLSSEEYQKALKAYYQHKDHTAWRYIAKPNPWMNPEASYVYHNKARGARWSTFEEYQPLIALLWLAATDLSTPPIDGHTFESRLDHFVDELALIGRAHNWDNTRINDSGEEEEYDDLTGDKPSCFSGVKHRLFQSVLGHPLIIILTEDMILEEIRNFARDHFQSQIEEDNKQLLKEAFEEYLINFNDLKEEMKQLLASLNISNEKQHEFELYLVEKYGAQYAEDYLFHKLVRNKLSFASGGTDFFSQCHALTLDGLVGFYKLLNESRVNSDQKSAQVLKEAGFFKEKQQFGDRTLAPLAIGIQESTANIRTA